MSSFSNSLPGSTDKLLNDAATDFLTSQQKHYIRDAANDLLTAPKGKYIEDRYERNSRFQFLWNKLGSVLRDINKQCGREVLLAITSPKEEGEERKMIQVEFPAINLDTMKQELFMTRKVVEIEKKCVDTSEKSPSGAAGDRSNVQNQIVFVKQEKDDSEYGIKESFLLKGDSVKLNREEQDDSTLVDPERCYPCNQCSKTYKQKGHLGAHIRSAHQGVRFPCPHCEYKSTTNGNRKKHIESKHPEAFQDFTVTEDMVDNENYDHMVDYEDNDHEFGEDLNEDVDTYDIDDHVEGYEVGSQIGEAHSKRNIGSEPLPKRPRVGEGDMGETDPGDSQKATISDFLEVCVDDGVEDSDLDGDDNEVDNDASDEFVEDNDNSLDSFVLNQNNIIIKQEASHHDSLIKQEELEESEIIDARIYPCDQCDKTFKQKGHLGVHLKAVHQGIRFPCSICDYKATTKGNLKQHVGRRHKHVDNDMIDYDIMAGVVDTETNGVLAIMDNSFGFKEEHPEEIEIAPPIKCYPCELCDKTFKQKGHLGVHIKSFHQGMRFPCNLCDYKATTNGNLKRHIDQRHVPQTESMLGLGLCNPYSVDNNPYAVEFNN